MLTSFRVLTAATLLVSAAPQSADDPVLSTYIHAHAQGEHGEEFAAARKSVSGDLDGDGQPETVVLYTLESQEGSNDYSQYLAVFSRTSGSLRAITRARVGGKSQRSVSLTSVDHLAIQLDTLDYAPADASCCPSLKGTTTFVLAGGELRENRPRAR